MIYQVSLEAQANLDLDRHERAGNKILLRRIQTLLNELEEHPTFGTGKPHRLRHQNGVEVWSRRIDDQHRMIYAIDGNVVTVFVIALWGHYRDK